MACLPVWQEERQKIFFSEEKKQKTFAPCACCGIQAMAGNGFQLCGAASAAP
jgi:hypothetical protein